MFQTMKRNALYYALLYCLTNLPSNEAFTRISTHQRCAFAPSPRSSVIAFSSSSPEEKNNIAIDVDSEELKEAVEQPNILETQTSLLTIASSSDRGQCATTAERTAAAALIVTLEESNSNTSPTTDSTIEGTWELLYSDTQLFRSSPFFMAGRAVCATEEEAKQYDWFCDMHREALAISRIGKVRQIISSARMTSEFEVKVGSVPFLPDFTPFAYSGGLPVTIEGAIVSTADITPTRSGSAWEIFMDTVEIKGSNIPFLRQILDNGLKLKSRDLGTFLEENVNDYTNPKPIFETTYLDNNMRISRDQDGKVFVYGKTSDVTEPTTYSNVDSDMGVTRLLEGINDSIFKFYI